MKRKSCCAEGEPKADPTRNVLDDVGHQRAEMAADILQRVRILVVLSFQELPCEVHILQQCAVQGVCLSVKAPTPPGE